ncbi:efflux transporter periplasmic adaptor subunit [Bacillus sp. MUM 116]|uniref:efflux RND transporter periplasmic adaptor subunit n=1 Tax=Bacillus sp. MUM 116 TaxID=1678002 RepID=UPI0008F5CC2A|nr:efflux RND transporter periplasmic adaptor subunit [Bacillus sp. MUM 116]OIK15595.1 efflux transporter periplasmic adaptor subunit [Bacillus sp. MUM 116]
MKKGIVIVLCVLVVGFVGFQWYNSRTSAKEVISQVRTAVVQKGKMEVKISGSGTVQPVTSEDIKSPIENNEIYEVLVSTGESVKKGEALITFKDGSDPITAPASGEITSLSVQAGQRVTNGQVVAHLTNYENLQTVVQIDELDIPKVKKDQAVSIKVNAYPDQTYMGKVSAIADEGTSTNGVSTFDVAIHITKPSNLKVGMTTEASILTASKNNALYVPIDAVHAMNNQKFVLVQNGNSETARAQRKVVKTGLANEDYVEILQGLNEGEIIKLPQLAQSTSSTAGGNRRMMQGSFGSGFGGFGNGGGFNRNGGGQGFSGRTGN